MKFKKRNLLPKNQGFTPRNEMTRGFGIIEVIVAIGIFAIVAIGGLTDVVGSFSTARLGDEYTEAILFTQEGIEAIRSIKNQAWSNIAAGTFGLNAPSTGVPWAFAGTSNTLDSKFTRQLTVAQSQRDGSGNIVDSGGTADPDTYKALSRVTWNVTSSRLNTIDIVTYLTNWRKAIAAPGRGGILVYGNGGTTTDAIVYRILDASAGTWNTAASTADVDAATANKALRAAQVYASSTRNEKVLLSRHYNGTAQFIYAQVFNGTTWGNVVQLSTWSATTFLDVQNFSGTYLANGNFMVIYSDNTTTPKFRIWNGTSWAAQASLPVVGGIPNYVVAAARPATNEVMAAFFDQASDTNTAYYNGSTWTLHTEHSAVSPANTKRMVDFAWSPNNTLKGALVYADSGTDKAMNIKIWTANGTGGGSWSATANTTAQTSNLGALSVSGRKGADEFIACDKDATATPLVICYKSNFTPVWSNPTNRTIAAATDTGIQRSYDTGFEAQSGDPAIAVYADNTVIPKLKKYTAATSTWDLTATNLNTLGGFPETVRFNVDEQGDDIMVLMADTNQDLYSIVWDGTANAMFTTPSGKAFSAHGTSGVADENFWFDFAWDKF